MFAVWQPRNSPSQMSDISRRSGNLPSVRTSRESCDERDVFVIVREAYGAIV